MAGISQAFSDSLFGELLQEIDALGVAQDTVVAMTADHGRVAQSLRVVIAAPACT